MGEVCTQCGHGIPDGSPFGICPRCCLAGPGRQEEDLIEGIELGEMIGRGAFGEVYAGVVLDHSLREVAVKILGEAGLERSRFLEEMQILALLKHVNIAQMTGSGETRDGRPYYHMELVEGTAMDDYQGPALPVMIQIAEAVSHAHRNGVIHRDLKPGNVLVTAEGVVKVIDFGIARVVSGPIAVSHAATQNMRLGTPLYMSPEQLEGNPRIDTRTDVYSLGLLFYELCLGRPVLEGVVSPEKSWSANAEALEGFGFPRLEPREFNWVARKACAYERGDRYQSVDAFLADLRSIEKGTLVSAGTKSRLYLAKRFVRRHRQALMIFTLLLALLVSLTGMSLSMAAKDRRAREEIGGSMKRLQSAESKTRVAASDARLREANLALERDDAMEALRIVDLALELNAGNDEAVYFRNFLLATRAIARVIEGPSIDFEIASVELHEKGFLVASKDGESAVVERERERLSHPASDVEVRDEKGLVTFTSRETGESLISPILYSSGEGLSCFSSKTGVLATVSKEEGLQLRDVSDLRTPSARKIIEPSVAWLSFERGKETLWMVNGEASLYFWPSWSKPLRISKVEGFGPDFFERVSLANRRDYLWTFWQGGNQRGLAGSKAQNLIAMRAVKQHTEKAGTSVGITTMARDRDVVLFTDSAGAIGVRNDKGAFDFLPEPVMPVKRMALSGEGGLGAAIFESGEIAVFVPSTRESLCRWKPAGVPRCLALLDHEDLLLVGFEDGSIHFVNPRDGSEVRPGISVGGAGLEIAVVPHHDEFLTRLDGDLHVRRWDAKSGELLHSGMRHQDGVLWFSCSLDGKFLFSIDQKEKDPVRGFLRVWSLRSGQEIVPALAHGAPLNCATIYENGRLIATAAADGSVRRWAINQESR
ncbi:serine/threonine-protein kinase [Verrucomicrobiaceae bacterium 227]